VFAWIDYSVTCWSFDFVLIMYKILNKRIEFFETLLKPEYIHGFGRYNVPGATRISYVFPEATTIYDADTGYWYWGDGETVGGIRIPGSIGVSSVGNNDIVWDDIRFPFTQTRVGALTKPDFDTTNVGLLFPQDDATEIVYILAQMEHIWKLESTISPHIHYIQSAAAQPTFKMAYRWYKNGATVPGSYTVISTADGSKGIFPYTSGSILQIAEFPDIAGTGIDTVSSFLDIKIYREDDDVTGDVLTKEFDIHIQIDAIGSLQEYTKY